MSFIVNDDMFGTYVKIPTGTSRYMHIYKVIGRIESNRYCDIPLMEKKCAVHSEIVPVLNVVHCGVSEDTVIRVALSDCEIVQPPNAPLTLEELREMNGEPVWVVVEDEIIMCALVEVAEENVWLTNYLGGRSEYRFDEPIEDGIVLYRYKPEKGERVNELL